MMLLLHTGAYMLMFVQQPHVFTGLSSVHHLLPDNQFVKPLREESCRSQLKMTPIREVRGKMRNPNSHLRPSECFYS